MKLFFQFLDEEDFRNLVIWLEDQVIRLYKIEDRNLLRETSSSEWPSILEKVYKN